jgi:ketosteroid isomerase-like protein
MKRLFSRPTRALLASMFAVLSIAARASEADDVAQAVERMRMAMLASDGPALRGLIEDSLSYRHSTGLIEDRQAFPTTLNGTNATFKSLKESNQTVKVAGDVAWVRNNFDAAYTFNGKALAAHLGVLQVRKKHPDGWRLLARQAHALPQS